MSNIEEQTYIMIKPDGVQRGLVGEIIKRFEQRGYHLSALKMVQVYNNEIIYFYIGRDLVYIFVKPTETLLQEHYKDLSAQSFFPTLVKFMASGPVVCMVWSGLNAVKAGRSMLGETNPQDSKPGSIRGDYCILTSRNIIHGSDSIESAQREICLWFKPEEVINF